jgi:hypothetical protein
LPKLSREQLAEVEVALAKGAEATGYTTDLWTLKRVAEVIERVTGVTYHQLGCGTSCPKGWVGAGNDRHAEPRNATTRPSSDGSSDAGHS